jgi:hypothetical protein
MLWPLTATREDAMNSLFVVVLEIGRAIDRGTFQVTFSTFVN